MSNDAPKTEAGTGGMHRRGLMLVLSSPSGAGKSTISRMLLAGDDALSLSVSATTRTPRPSEIDGEDYHFVSGDAFETMAANGEFLEHAEVFGRRYGTPRAPVEETLKAGRDVLFDIDWQGAQQIGDKAREDVVTVFILPPSVEELARRLKTRAQDTEEEVQRRMAKAVSEMSHYAEYEYVIVNKDVEKSTACVRAVLAAERQKRKRLAGLNDFVRTMGVKQ
ncbi:MAG: guanylate kinase [Rhodospirillales bacterium]